MLLINIMMLWTLWDKFLSYKKSVLGLNILCYFFYLVNERHLQTYLYPQQFTWPLTEIFFRIVIGESRMSGATKYTRNHTAHTGMKAFQQLCTKHKHYERKSKSLYEQNLHLFARAFPGPILGLTLRLAGSAVRLSTSHKC